MISLGILTYNNTFKFQITTTTPNETFTLPINAGGAGYTQNFTANWGDTTSSEITAYNDPDRIHTYAVAGTYDIELNGTCEWFAFDNGGDKTKIKKLLAFTGDMGFKVLNFSGCSALNTIISLGTMASLTNVYRTNTSGLFQNCTSITSIPSGMFNGCPAITDFSYAFYMCNNAALTSIPVDLFRYNTAVTSFAYTFGVCNKITSLNSSLFQYNTLVTSFERTFYSCFALTAIPIDLFRYNIAATTFSYTFGGGGTGCLFITSIPIDLFRYNIAAISFAYTFQNCSGLTSIPTDLFRYNTVATAFNGTFNGCVKAQYNINIFYAAGEEGTRFLNKSVTFGACFSRSTFSGVQGTAPDLWNCNFGTGTPTRTNCYSGAGNSLTSLTNYADIPTVWKS
jgi:hypothetical protein